jgi:hypothetical protein
MNIWKPQEQSPPRPSPAEQEKFAYLRSYLLMRAVIGFIGIALPVSLLLGDIAFLKGDTLPRGSLSAYYHSGMRDLFVGTLCAIGVFLITYRVFDRISDNLLSTVAGFAALAVAFFPTGRPTGSQSPATPLQQTLGEGRVTVIHFVFAAIFIASLAITCYSFGVREGGRSQQRWGHKAKRSPLFWRWFHWSCALLIVAAVVFSLIMKTTGWLQNYSLIIGESIAVLAFGVSWLMKGLELDVLLAPKVAEQIGIKTSVTEPAYAERPSSPQSQGRE